MDPTRYHPPDRLRQLPSWLLGQATARGNRAVAAALADAGLRRQHYAVLLTLKERGPLSQAALGRDLSMDRSDVHGVLADLERDGLVDRATDAADRRRNTVRLTRSGAVALRRLDARVAAAQGDLLGPLSTAERAELVRLLTLLADETA
jgi:DNA-binding MarR family transcriptional regulator